MGKSHCLWKILLCINEQPGKIHRGAKASDSSMCTLWGLGLHKATWHLHKGMRQSPSLRSPPPPPFPLTGLPGTLKITWPAQQWDFQVRVFCDGSERHWGYHLYSLCVKIIYVKEYVRTPHLGVVVTITKPDVFIFFFLMWSQTVIASVLL